MSGIESVALTAVAMQSATTKQDLSIAMLKQQQKADQAVVEMVTVATEAMKGQVVNLTA